jgi:hypothetical protein
MAETSAICDIYEVLIIYYALFWSVFSQFLLKFVQSFNQCRIFIKQLIVKKLPAVRSLLMFFIPGVEGDEVIPGLFNLCASFQMAITRHLCQRLQRGMEFVALQHLLPPSNRTLVCRLSGVLFFMFYLATHSLHQNICCQIFGDDQKAN